MKNLLLLFVITFISSMGYTQGIPEKANTITITLADSNAVKEKVLKVFSGKDYPIAKNSSSSISTGAKTLKNNTRVLFNAQLQGAEVILTGSISIAGQGGMPIVNKGVKGSNSMIAWEEMTKIAKALGGSVKYEVK